MELIEEVRSLLIQEKIGLIAPKDIISFVDNKILSLNDPPDYLISISTKESLNFMPWLDLVMDKINDKDCSIIAKILIDKLHSNEISYNDIGIYAINFWKILDDNAESFGIFHWIDDEISLMNDGIKEECKSKKDIIDRLYKISKF